MYTTKNFKTKKALKEAVSEYNIAIAKERHASDEESYASVKQEWKENGSKVLQPITIFAPGLGSPVKNGWDTVEGPHFPEPHKWYARVRLVDGIVVEVK